MCHRSTQSTLENVESYSWRMVILIIQTNAKCVTGKMLNTTTIATATCTHLLNVWQVNPAHTWECWNLFLDQTTHIFSSDQNWQTNYLYYKGARKGLYEVFRGLSLFEWKCSIAKNVFIWGRIFLDKRFLIGTTLQGQQPKEHIDHNDKMDLKC